MAAFYFLLFVATSIFASSLVSANSTRQIKILFLNTSSSLFDVTKCIDDGLKVAFANANDPKKPLFLNNISFNVIYKETINSSQEMQAIDEAAQDPEVFGVFGTFGDEILLNIRSKLEEKGLILFTPFVDTSNAYVWTPNIVYTTPHEHFQYVAILTELILIRQLSRIGFVYTIDKSNKSSNSTLFINDSVQYVNDSLQVFGLNLKSVFRALNDIDDKTFNKEWDSFVSGDPQAAMIWDIPSDKVLKFMEYCITKMSYKPFVIIVSSSFISLMDDLYDFIKTNKADYSNITILIVSNAPTPRDTRFKAIERFRDEYNNARALGIKTHYNLSFFYKDEGLGALTVTAWLGAKVMLKTFARMKTSNFSRDNIIPTLFDSQIINIDDLNYGIYSFNCSGTLDMLASGTAFYPPEYVNCHSNQGGHSLELYSQSTLDGKLKPVNRYTISLVSFDGSLIDVKRATVIFQPLSNGELSSSVSLFLIFLQNSKSGNDNDNLQIIYMNISNLQMQGVDIKMSNNHQLLYAAQINHYISACVGGNVQLPLDSRITIPVIAPITVAPQLHAVYGYRRNVIHLLATLEQEMLATAAYIYYLAKGNVSLNIVTRSSATTDDIISSISVKLIVLDINTGMDNIDETSKLIKHILESSLNTYLIKLHSVDYFNDVSVLINLLLSGKYSIKENSFLYVFGYYNNLGLIKALDVFLERNPTVKVVIPFNTLMIHYDTITSTITDVNRQDQILFATSMPPWIPQNNSLFKSNALNYYYASTSNNTTNRTPLTITLFYASLFLRAVADSIPSQVTSKALLDQVYILSLVSVDVGLTFGPYVDNLCSESTSDLCEKNYPTMPIYVRSLAVSTGKIINLNKKSFVWNSPDLIYFDLPVAKSSIKWYVILIIVILLLLFILAVIIGLFCYLKRNKRDVRYAPKDPAQPFTLIFTDIQRSTSLWATVPEVMASALDTHHKLIRNLISKHKGYEVKTIGDAFMIAFQHTSDALALAYELQFVFYNFDWGSYDIDECYCGFERQFVDEADYDEASANVDWKSILPYSLSPEQYQESWNGLRVRVGVHTGFGDIQLDPVSRGYDYYGSVSNIAARTESVAYGGQTVVTGNAKKSYEDELEEKNSSERYLWHKFGFQTLRGVPEPVELFQLDTVPGRIFGPLRLEVQPVTEEIEDEVSETATTSVSSVQKDDVLLAICYLTIETLFSSLPEKKRIAEFQRLCKQWRVHHRTNKVNICNKYILGIQRKSEISSINHLSAKSSVVAFSDNSESNSINTSVLPNEDVVAPNNKSISSSNSRKFSDISSYSRCRTSSSPIINYLYSLSLKISSVTAKKMPISLKNKIYGFNDNDANFYVKRFSSLVTGEPEEIYEMKAFSLVNESSSCSN